MHRGNNSGNPIRVLTVSFPFIAWVYVILLGKTRELVGCERMYRKLLTRRIFKVSMVIKIPFFLICSPPRLPFFNIDISDHNYSLWYQPYLKFISYVSSSLQKKPEQSSVPVTPEKIMKAGTGYASALRLHNLCFWYIDDLEASNLLTVGRPKIDLDILAS